MTSATKDKASRAKAGKKARAARTGSKAALPFKRRSGYFAPPEDLYLERDPDKKHYDPRVHHAPVERDVVWIMTHGVQKAVLVEKCGELVVVVDGRQRVINALEANRRLRKSGLEPILVPVAVKRGDARWLFEVSVICNEHRKPDDPVTQAFKMQRYLNMGHTEADAASLWGVTGRTVLNRLYLLGLCDEVRKAVAEGSITVSSALALRHMTDAEQRLALAAPVETAPKRRRPGTKKVKRVLSAARLSKQVKAAIKWATGAITDEEAAEAIGALGSLLSDPEEDPRQQRLFE